MTSSLRVQRWLLRRRWLYFARYLLLISLSLNQLRLRATAQSAQSGRAATPSGSPVLREKQRLIWMRAHDASRSPLEVRVEQMARRKLAELGLSLNVSPLPFHDAQLASGCTGTIRQCGGEIAAVLESEQLAVSVLEDRPAPEQPTLRLFLFASGEAVRDGTARLPREPQDQLELTVHALVDRVFGKSLAESQASQLTASRSAPVPQEVLNTPVQGGSAATTHTRVDAERARNPALRAVGWSTLGVGIASWVGALALAVAAKQADERYAKVRVLSEEDADRALRNYDSAERRSHAAWVLTGVGGGMVASGAFMLLWERLATRKDRNLHEAERSLEAADSRSYASGPRLTKVGLARLPAGGTFWLGAEF